MFRYNPGIALCVIAMAVSPVAAQERADRNAEVLAFERTRLDATIRKDVAALDGMTTDDLTYVHASGIRQTKGEYLAYVRAGGVTFGSFGIEDEQVEFNAAGTAAVTHGVFTFTTDASVQPARSGRTIFTAVYVRDGRNWRLSAWEATKTS